MKYNADIHIFPDYKNCARTKYRIRRCCAYCQSWDIWRNDLIIESNFASGQDALRFYHASTHLFALQAARVELQKKESV